MAIPPLGVGTAFGALIPFLDYFRPTRSPYLLIVIFSIVALLYSNEKLKGDHWYWVAIPIALVLVVVTAFTFIHAETEDAEQSKEERDTQLKFSRSICISTAVLCLVWGSSSDSASELDSVFFVNYVMCICQIVVFVIYTAARLKKEEPPLYLNHFQVALVTSALLVGATVCIHSINPGLEPGSIFAIIKRGNRSSFFAYSAVLLYFLWARCQYYWINRLTKVIKISIV